MNRPETQTLAEDLMTVFRRDDPDADSKINEQANVRVIQRLYDAFLGRDIVALLDGMAEDVEWDIAGPQEVPFTGACRGHEEVARVLQKSFATVKDQQPEYREVIAQGDTVTVHGHEHGTHPPTGKRYETTWVHVFTLRNDKIAKFYEQFDHEPVLEALQARTS